MRDASAGPLRPTLAAAALAALALAVTIGLVGSSARAPERSRAETAARRASRAGDVPRRVRAEPPEAREEAAAEEDGSESAADAAVLDEPEAPDPDAPPQRVIRIVDGDGVPIPGVVVEITSDDWRRTDLDGEASFDATSDATRIRFFDGAATRGVTLADSRTEVVVTGLPALDVSAVDARTGVALDPVRFHVRRADGERREAWTGGQRPALGVTWYGGTGVTLEIDPPPGYGGYRTVAWDGDLATRARRVRLVVPLFETTERRVQALLPGGAPARAAIVDGATVCPDGRFWWDAAREVTFRATQAGADGVVRVDGLPQIPFTRLALRVAWTGRVGDADATLAAVVPDIDPCAAAPEEPIVATLGSDEPADGPSSASGCGAPGTRAEGPTARLAVRVLHRDGTPARRVRVDAGGVLGWTDRDGRVSFTAVASGPADVLAVAHGFTATIVRAEVGKEETLEIVEAEPRTVRVVVRDQDGDPVPSARVLAQCDVAESADGVRRDAHCSVAQLDGDVEDVAPLTDRLGVAVLRVPRGDVAYRVTLGEADDSATSSADEVTIVLRDPYR